MSAPIFDASGLLSSEFPIGQTLADIQRNLAEVQQRIQQACIQAGRAPDSVRLLPVSKTLDENRIRLAYAACCRLLGENKVQEAHRKWEAMSDLPELKWAVIGHLQTNKAKLVARFAHEFHSLDSIRLAEALQRRLDIEQRSLDVFVQVNTSGEPSKYGLSPEQLLPFIDQLHRFPNLNVRGLMTLALFSQEAERVRPCFALLRELRDQAQKEHPELTLNELSMGMSGDYPMAIAEGATIVRVGQAIFGARALPNSYYWPTETA